MTRIHNYKELYSVKYALFQTQSTSKIQKFYFSVIESSGQVQQGYQHWLAYFTLPRTQPHLFFVPRTDSYFSPMATWNLKDCIVTICTQAQIGQ